MQSPLNSLAARSALAAALAAGDTPACQGAGVSGSPRLLLKLNGLTPTNFFVSLPASVSRLCARSFQECFMLSSVVSSEFSRRSSQYRKVRVFVRACSES